jgi:hypothetical protein
MVSVFSWTLALEPVFETWVDISESTLKIILWKPMRVYWSYVRHMISPYGAGLHAGRYSKKLQRWMFLPVINLTAFIQEPMAECSLCLPIVVCGLER